VSPVIVSTAGADTVSAPVTCTGDQTFSADTAGTDVNGSCTNDAGLDQAAAPVTVKIDTTPPTDVALNVISGTAGAHGWYTSDVVVRTTGADATSGVTCTTDQTVTAQGTTEVTGHCTNGAGLTTDAAPLTLHIDDTAPSASLSVSAGTLGANGWYTSGVTVSTTGSDDTSAVICTADQTVTAQGTTVVTGSCTNDAGLTTAAEPLTLDIDTTPPTNVVLTVVSGTPGANGWYTSDVVVRTTGEDATSGVTCSADQIVSDQGATEITGHCTNGAGRRTDAQPITILVDQTAPSAELSIVDGTAGANGWFTSDVTVATTGSDDVSGPVTCTTDQVVSTETSGTTLFGSCTNAAGLSTQAASLTVKLDQSGPSATITPSGTVGTNGWFTSDVTVQTTGSDDISGPVSCADAQVLSNETAGTTVHGSCTNDAGLKTDAAPATVKIDQTNPTAVLSVAGTLGAGGWYVSPIVVSTIGADTVSSPVSCSTDQTFSADTAETDVNGSCTNDAGLSQAAATVTVKVDTTPPVDVVLNVVSGTPGAHGWYTSDVMVRTTGDDPTSGVTCSTDQTVTTQGATELTGHCTNAAGLTTDAAPLTVRIDHSAPTAALVVTGGTVGANGWYTSAVTVATTGGDDVSGPVTCTADQTLSSDGDGQTVTGSCTNDAGLTTSAAPLTLAIDTSAPVDVALSVVSGTPGANGWYTTDVVVGTTGADATSGVACTTDQVVSDQGPTVVKGHCTNGAGLVTEAAPLTIRIDHSAPSATLVVTGGTVGANGWFTSDVTVATTGSDDVSGPVTCTVDQVVASDTSGTVVTGSCTNGAGLTTAANPLTVKLDETGPSATTTPSGTVGDNGWYTSDVTVSTTGSDDISGPVSCTATQILSTETTGTTLQGSCTNDAGLTTDSAPVIVKVDKTNPTTALSVAGTLGTAGWYVSPVVVSTIGGDTTSSPVSCTADQAFAADTTGTPVDGSCTNDAGLTQAAATVTVKIDTTPPTNVALNVVSGTAGAHGWYTSDVVVRTTGADSTSDVTCSTDQTVTAQGTTQVTGHCTNGAGLTTDAAPLTLRIDHTAPSATLSVTSGSMGLNGWYTSDVVVQTTGADDVSGPVTCTADQRLTDESASVTVTGSCTNDAGLTTAAIPLTLKIDKFGPTALAFVAAAGPASESAVSGGIGNGSSYVWGSLPGRPGCTATDRPSGLASCVVTGYSTAVGPHTLTAMATDNAGNSSSTSLTYTVLAWRISGFFQPVSMDTASDRVVNLAKGGSTVPLKFEVFAGATELTSTSAVKSLQIARTDCVSVGGILDPVDALATGGTVLRHDGGQFIYNWKTPTQANTCWDVVLTTQDGSGITAHFKLK
jgi:large repetitive protein